MTSRGYAKIEYDEIEQFTVGGIPIVIGKVSGANVYGAALTQAMLQSDMCGFGTNQNEAIADLFKLRR